MNTVGTPLLWGGFAVVVVIMLAIDLLLQGRRGAHTMSMKQAAAWSIVWVTLSLLFNAAFWWYLAETQGRAVADPQALAFLTGYLIEKSLAVDNVFVWLMLFSYFSVPPALQRRVLVYGVLGAIVLRTIMIFAGSWLITQFEWLLYVFGAFLLAFIGIGAMLYNLQAAVSNFEYVLSFASLVFVVIVPVLTMRVLAEERRQKTDQLLYSLPITTVQIIAGKYLALLVLYLIPLAIIAVYPLIFAQFGDVYLLTSYGSILAFFLLGAALIAVGVFLSSLTDNQGLAAGLGIAVILLNYYSVSLSEYVSSTPVGALAALLVLILAAGAVVRYLTRNSNLAYGVCLVLLAAVAALYFVDSTAFEGLLPTVMSALSLFERFYTFVNGVFDLTAVFYYLTVAALFLFLSVQSLEKRRYN